MTLFKLLASSLAPTMPAVIAITGAGGKTNTLKNLALYFKERGESVLLTTTTKIQSPKNFPFMTDYAFTKEEDVLSHEPKKGESVYYAELKIDPKKAVSPRIEILKILSKRYDVMLIEADGAKTLPLKIHTERDPVVPSFTTATLGIIGATALGEAADNVCFGCPDQSVVDTAFLQNLIDDEQGVTKAFTSRSAILINQCDAVSDLAPFRALRAKCKIIMGSVFENKVYI